MLAVADVARTLPVAVSDSKHRKNQHVFCQSPVSGAEGDTSVLLPNWRSLNRDEVSIISSTVLQGVEC